MLFYVYLAALFSAIAGLATARRFPQQAFYLLGVPAIFFGVTFWAIFIARLMFITRERALDSPNGDSPAAFLIGMAAEISFLLIPAIVFGMKASALGRRWSAAGHKTGH
jgi:hypothetical protein